MSEDVIASIQAIRKLGVKVIVKNDICKMKLFLLIKSHNRGAFCLWDGK